MRFQRGDSESIFFQHAGDPLTPGWASTKEAHRNPNYRGDGSPAKFLSRRWAYRDAETVCSGHWQDQTFPRGWQGGLPFAYHIGPGTRKSFTLKFAVKHKNRPNLQCDLQKLKGTEKPGSVGDTRQPPRCLGFTALADPSSGTASPF